MKNTFFRISFIIILIVHLTSCKIHQTNFRTNEAIHIGNPLEVWLFSGIFQDSLNKTNVGYSYFISHSGDKLSKIEAISAFLTIADHTNQKSISEVRYMSIDSDSIPEFSQLKFKLPSNYNNWLLYGKNGFYKLSATMTEHTGNMIKLRTENNSGCYIMPDSLSNFSNGAKTFIYPSIKTSGKIRINGNLYKVNGNSNYLRLWDASEFINKNQRIGQIIINTNSSGDAIFITLKFSKDGLILKYSGYGINMITRKISRLNNISVKCEDYWQSNISKKTYPIKIQINIPETKCNISLFTNFRNQEMTLIKSAMWIGFVEAQIIENNKKRTEKALMLFK